MKARIQQQNQGVTQQPSGNLAISTALEALREKRAAIDYSIETFENFSTTMQTNPAGTGAPINLGGETGGGTGTGGGTRRTVSPAARRKIAAAQKKRWADKQAAATPAATTKGKPKVMTAGG